MDSFVGLKLFFEDKLGRKVDLVTRDALRARTRSGIERDAVDIT